MCYLQLIEAALCSKAVTLVHYPHIAAFKVLHTYSVALCKLGCSMVVATL